jgi:hypothetical protein
MLRLLQIRARDGGDIPTIAGIAMGLRVGLSRRDDTNQIV